MRFNASRHLRALLDKTGKMSKWKKVISGLIICVFFCTTYLLICPAITLDHETVCGMEEHQHDDSCFEERKTLVCPLEEGEDHTHTDDCYVTEKILICDKPEHTHTDECYAQTEEQQTEQEAQTADNTVENPAIAAEEVIDGKIPTETEEQWKQSFAQVVLTDDPGHNMTEIAKTQINYSENTEDVVTLVNDVVKGFTRYGAWYGKDYEYADWNDLFVFWCMNYAGVDKQLIPDYKDPQMNFGKWIELLNQQQLFKTVYEYDPKVGDLVFIDQDDKNKQDGVIDAVGIISERTEDEDGKLVSLKVIIGDQIDKAAAAVDPAAAQQDKVVETTYLAEDPAIASYAIMAKQEVQDPEAADPEAPVTLTTTMEDGTVLTLNGKAADFPFPAEEIILTAVEIGVSEEMDADEEIRSDNAVNLISKSLGDEAKQLAGIRLFDITLWHNGEEIEPTGTVELSISEVSAADAEAADGETTDAESETYAVYHIDEQNQIAEDMKAETGENGELVISTDHFSIYGVAAFLDESLNGASGLPGTITTVDNNADGITINLFDYYSYTVQENSDTPAHDKLEETNNNYGNANWARQGYDVGINSGHPLKFYSWGTRGTTMNNYTGENSSHEGIAMQGIVQNKLSSSGYPLLNSNGSGLNYLFDPNSNQGSRTDYLNTNHLLKKDSNGYYVYDSDQNYAYYNQGSGNFSVYDKTYYVNNDYNKKIAVGFFPFNQYNEDKNIINPWEHGKTKDKKYQNNHHFGMTMTANFMMPEGGKVNGNDMIFEFSGDDDVWVFIDGVLVLDMGGIHGEVSGKIDFAKGTYEVNDAKTCDEATNKGVSVAGTSGTIQSLYQKAGVNYDFSDYSEHTISFFYVERGGCYSNCSLNFNLPTFQKKQIELEKKVTGNDDLSNKEFQFQLYTTRGQGDDNFTVYKGSAQILDKNGNTRNITIGGDGIFTLKADEKIIFPEMISLRKYYFKEVGINSSEIEKVIVNGTEYTPSPGINGYEIETTPQPIKDQCQVVATNAAPTVDLKVNKVWSDGNSNHNGGYVTYHILRRHKGSTEDWTDINKGNAYYIGSNDNWSVTHEKLPKSDENGVFEYKVVEDSVSGYYPSITSITNGSTTTFKIENNKEPEKPKVAVEKQWYNSDGTTTSPFSKEVEIELWRRYTIPAPATSHTVTFYASAYVWDANLNKQVKQKFQLQAVEVADGGSVSFASSLWTNRVPNLVYGSGGVRPVKTGETYPVEGQYAIQTPIYKCSNITADASVTIEYDDIWESAVKDVRLEIRDKTEPQQSSGTSGTVMEEKVASVKLNTTNSWKKEWTASELPAENELYQPYTYYVKEVTEVPGFTVSYENNDGITEGTITVRNTATNSYELPNTGGIGTQWYTLSGLIVVLSAAMMWSCKLKKRHGRRQR